ncbi:MAG: hypothetical protein B7O98_04525 [Zestosphaera tikiterensis]|uniref:Uncharacterized protein n=1 Tax=Zestosphaera tikiterensis TaxID=1973259 RepID=A0A2R7Y828_9CREN|nr:MAG: hypothetical protein B7O98_04525 [Zestosphaera tikiterensis]
MKVGELILKVVPRLVALAVLWDSITILTQELPKVTAPQAFILSLISTPSNMLLTASSVVAVLTVATSSPTLYVFSVILLAVGRGVLGYAISPSVIAGLALVLILDTLALTYRSGQRTSVRMGGKAFTYGVLSVAFVFLGVITASLFFSQYLTTVVTTILSVSKYSVVKYGVLASLIDNPLIKLCVVVLIVLFLYEVIVNVFDTASIYLRPSRKVCLSTLKNRSDIDVVIERPLQTLFTLILASLVAPVIYVFLIDIITPKLVAVLTPLSGFLKNPYVAAALSLATYALAFALTKPLISSLTVEEVKLRNLTLPATLSLFIYLSAVLISYDRGLTLSQSFLSPDFTTLSNTLYRGYLNFYTSLFYILEIIPKLVGAAP